MPPNPLPTCVRDRQWGYHTGHAARCRVGRGTIVSGLCIYLVLVPVGCPVSDPRYANDSGF
jgi:hypothetical protein